MKNNVPVLCPKCSQEIGSETDVCPHCGHHEKNVIGFEWRSSATIGPWPLVHVAFGRNKKTGRWLVAKGVIAVGQYALGLVTFAQFGIGFLFGFGQFMVGYYVVAQFAAAMTAVAQFAFGKYVLAQAGFGQYVWSVTRKDPVAIEYFKHLWLAVEQFFGFN